jgi:hypothetical protein
LSDSNDHAGFSFQLSETPPPTQADGRTPLGDLELDLRDFGEIGDDVSPAGADLRNRS